MHQLYMKVMKKIMLLVQMKRYLRRHRRRLIQ
jgi:hypothetical protein